MDGFIWIEPKKSSLAPLTTLTNDQGSLARRYNFMADELGVAKFLCQGRAASSLYLVSLFSRFVELARRFVFRHGFRTPK